MPYVGRDAASFTTVVDVTVSDDLTVTDDAAIGGVLSAKGGAVFNEDSADVDFRVESNGNANMLFVDGGNDAVGIGNNNPADYGALIDNFVIGTTSGNNGMTIASGTDSGGRICFADNTSSPQRGMIEYAHASDSMLLNANGATRITITSGGDIDVETGDIFFSTAGKGIVLGATSNTAANTLDDYEEGAISVLMQGGNGNPNTNVSLTGQYTKVGNMVAFRAQNESLNNTGAGGPIHFSGLPFASSGAYGIGTLAWDDLATITGIPYTLVSGNIAYIYENRNQANTIAVNHHVDTAGKFYISCVYQTNA